VGIDTDDRRKEEAMGLKTGFILGFGAGYVLGARAGRERYEQIRRAFNDVSGNPVVQRAVERTSETAGEQGKRALSVVQEQVEKAGSAVKERLARDDSSDTATPDSDPRRTTTGTEPAQGEGP
jgi:hypothetical protein